MTMTGTFFLNWERRGSWSCRSDLYRPSQQPAQGEGTGWAWGSPGTASAGIQRCSSGGKGTLGANDALRSLQGDSLCG